MLIQTTFILRITPVIAVFCVVILRNDLFGGFDKGYTLLSNHTTMQTDTIPWQWDDDDQGGLLEYEGTQFLISWDENNRILQLSEGKSLSDLKLIWQKEENFYQKANLAKYKHILFIGMFSPTFTGCKLVALDLNTKNILWEKTASALGSIGHSRYSNAIQLKIIENMLVIFGKESGGRYIEALSPETGEQVYHKIIS